MTILIGSSIVFDEGAFGDLPVPQSAEGCAEVAAMISTYLDNISQRFADTSAEITSNPHLQERILREGLRRVMT